MAAVSCKLLLMGNGSVGKTSICQRFKDDGFQRVYRQTTGVDFLEKTLEVRPGHHTSLQVWDIGGQSINSKMLSKYISGASVVFFCYDVTEMESFKDMADWVRMVTGYFSTMSTGSMPQLYLVGNKIDLIHLRKVTVEQHQRFVETHRLTGGFFVSARSGENLLTTFYKVAATVHGIELSAHELAFTEKVLGVTVTREADDGDDGEMDAATRKAAAEDAALAERNRRGGKAPKGGGCACVIS